jgi:class 3 adenylate cyclase
MATAASTPRRKLSAILMVDVSGFSRMMGRDEEGTTALIREFHDRTLKLVESREGRVVDTAGDSVFGEFDSVINAVRCAQAIQDAQAAVNADRQPNERVETRIGVHLGDVIVQDYQVYGDGVNIAARLQAVAAPGSICISEAVYQQVNNKLDLTFEDLGVRELKNIEHPIRLYRVVSSGPDRSSETSEARRDAKREPFLPAALAWKDALLHPWSLVPLMLGVYLMATVLGLPPGGRVFPSIGAVLVGAGIGRALRLRTGRRAFFLISLGGGLVLGAALTFWRGETPWWWLLLAGIIVITVGLTRLRPQRRASGT